MQKTKKIFISGVAGFLGSHLADKFIDDGFKVIGCDNLIGGYIDNVPSQVDFFQYDCNHLNSMIKISKDCDIFYHCAATAYEGLSCFSPYLVSQNVFQNSVAVFTAAIVNKAKRIIFCSSMARYGNNKTPFTEDQKTNPVDPYGISKVAAENILMTLSDIHNIEYCIAVPHNIFGPRQKYNDPYRNVASIMINLMLQGRQPIIYGDGEQKRCFSYIDDCIYCLKEMAHSEKVLKQVINIGPDEELITINKLAENIANILKFNVNPTYLDDRPQEVKLATCSSKKARELLGYRTNTNLKDGLIKTIEYIKKNKPKKFQYHLDLEIINKLTPTTWKNKIF
jgi:UDP-glucose 4-epimerase